MLCSTDILPGTTNYQFGNDPTKWQTNVPGYEQLTYPGVYPGADLRYHGEQGRLEYDFDPAPHADVWAIRLQVSGPSHLISGWMIRPNGSITLNTPFSGYAK